MTAPYKSMAFSLLALAGIGCAPVNSDSPIRLRGARPLSGTAAACAPDGEIDQFSGMLDIAATSVFRMSFRKESDLQALSIDVETDTLVGPRRNDFIGDQMQFEYTSTPPITFQSETVPIYAVIPAGEGEGDSWVSLNLISPKAAQTLRESLGRGDSLDLVVGFNLSGKLASGGPTLKSNTIQFPIKVYNSGFIGCPAGDRQAPTGPCGSFGGQDGSPVGCCSDDAFAEACGS